jgi:hypothetical protein
VETNRKLRWARFWTGALSLMTSELLLWISYLTTQSFLAEIESCSFDDPSSSRGATNPEDVALNGLQAELLLSR